MLGGADAPVLSRVPRWKASSSRGARGVDKGVAALDGASRRRLLGRFGRHHDGVLVHQLARGIGEGGERERDAVHFSLVHALIVLLLQVATAVNDAEGKVRLSFGNKPRKQTKLSP